MKKFIFLFCSLTIGFALFFIALKEVGAKNISYALSSFAFWQILLIFGMSLFGLAIGAWRWKIVLNAQKIFPKFSDIFSAKLIGHSINYLTPVMFAGGEPFKALALEKKADVPIEKGFASIVIEEVVFLSVSFVFAVIGVVLLFAHFSLPKYFIAALAGLIALSLFLLCVFFSKRPY